MKGFSLCRSENRKLLYNDNHILNYFFSGRLRKLYIEENPVQGVETILDIGTGTGGSAFVLGQLFPEVHT